MSWKKFKKIYGYELGVPVNWSAYEDIAEFFSVHVKEIDGVQIYGHMDYGKRAPDLGWRMTDAWLSMAGAGDKGLPNGKPVDEWGIRVDGCRPVGASVERGGAAGLICANKVDLLRREEQRRRELAVLEPYLEDEEPGPARSFNLASALHHVSGAMAFMA